MSIVNLQRDALFLATEKTAIDWGISSTFLEAADLRVDADPVVYDDYANIRSSRDDVIEILADRCKIVGCYLKAPGIGLTPYHVKAYASSPNTTIKYHVAIGFAPDVITGSDDAIEIYDTIPFTDHFDDLVMIPQEVAATEKALFFGVVAIGPTTSDVYITANISVQNLAVSPPQFSQSVS